MITVNLSREQAREFAAVIFRDIQEYIRTHPKEYAAFIKKEEARERGEDNECS